MKYDRADELLTAAVQTLAGGSGSVQERLRDAMARHLIHLEADELPPALRADFRRLYSATTSVRPNANEGSLEASTRKMSDGEVGDWIDLILRLHNRVYAHTLD